MHLQKTLRKIISCKGIGLHTARFVSLFIKPAMPDSGIVFIRTDLPGSPSIRAVFDYVSDTRYATTIKRGNASVSTIEHLMAAFAVMKIDNAVVEIDGPEVPIMDGSALSFVGMMRDAGAVEQDILRRYILVTKPVIVEHNGSEAAVYPSFESKITCSVDFKHPVMGPQSLTCAIVCDGFEKEISEARTFGFLKEIESLRAHGLALGGSLDNAIVIGEDGVINEEGLRYPDELVRHKVLDALGDLYLMGSPLIGHFVAVKGGHTLTHMLIRRLLSDTSCWEYIEFKGGSESIDRSATLSATNPTLV